MVKLSKVDYLIFIYYLTFGVQCCGLGYSVLFSSM